MNDFDNNGKSDMEMYFLIVRCVGTTLSCSQMAVQDKCIGRLHLCIINHPLTPALTFITDTHSIQKPSATSESRTAHSLNVRNQPIKMGRSANSRSSRKDIDQHFVRHVLDGYKNGGYIDVLIQELVDQGYRRPSYHEVAHNFLPFGLTLSADRVLNKEHKAEVHRAALSGPFVIDAPMLQFMETDRDGKEVEIKDPVRKQKLAGSVLGGSRRL